MKIIAVCGSFHKEEIESMLEFARDEAGKHSIEITEVIWVPGSMEVPLALNVIRRIRRRNLLRYNRKRRNISRCSNGNVINQ